MTRCPHCHRHHRAEETACPFCGRQARSLPEKLGRSAVACFSAMILMACYGAPPGGFDSGEDFDGDGYDAPEDCDDEDAAINPGATEDCADSKDNDCDELVDTGDTGDCP